MACHGLQQRLCRPLARISRVHPHQFRRPLSIGSLVTPHPSRLAGKTVFITGASSGIGRSTALAFARAEMTDLRIILNSRNREELENVKSQIRSAAGNGVQVCVLPFDVGNIDNIRNEMDKIPPGFREIDILINNAGVALGGLATTCSTKQADLLAMFHTNVLGMISLTRHLLPGFLHRGKGDIINIGSIAGRDPYEGAAAYCATKAAVSAFTTSLRRELVSTAIRVMEISPGQTQTRLAKIRFSGDPEAAERTYKGYVPLDSEDIAELVLFAASRPPHVVLADALVLCNDQATSTMLHRASPAALPRNNA